MSSRYDTIVIGLGGMGSAACAQLASRGQKVLGLEQFELGHARGSSHGDTRVIRAAYYEHPEYVPLLKRAYQLWEELENRTGCTLFHRTGVLVVGAEESKARKGVLRSAALHQIPVEDLTNEAVAKRFPQFHLPEGFRAVFEPNAGYLEVENSVLQHLRLAEREGAQFRIRESVTGWKASPGSVQVRTASGTYEASKLVITTGAWMGALLRELGTSFTILRKRLCWYAAGDEFLSSRGMPCYLFDLPEGVFYGFPKINERGLKIAEHSGGDELVVPEDLLDPALGQGPKYARAELERLQSFIKRCLSRVPAQAPLAETVCMYEKSADDHFIIDQHPKHSNVFLAGGFSGHGFKFASVVGEILADLAIEGRTSHPIEFLGLSRFKNTTSAH